VRLLDRNNDTSLAIALIASAVVIFQRPLRYMIDLARAAEAQYHIDLIPGLTVLVAALAFHQYRKRQQAKTAVHDAEQQAAQQQARSEELERLVTFGRALAAVVDASALRQTLWRYLPAFAPAHEFWLLRRTKDGWERFLHDATSAAGRSAEDIELAAAAAMDPQNAVDQRGGGIEIGGDVCFPMVVGAATVGVLGFRNTPALAHGERRTLGAAAAFIAIALRNVQLLAETKENSLRDELTGLFNRAHALESLDLEIRRSRRTSRPLSLLLFDLDGFKGINDQHGHLAGDSLLSGVGRLLGHLLRVTDIKCRYGGDEFLVILPDTPLPGARHVSEAFLGELASLKIQFGDAVLSVTGSAGLACADPHDGALELLARADEALYRAKRAGRNRVTVAGPELNPVRTG
jgi:diguanylate cyclase (GGDEF)-like protein